jgi:hypothetical protein
MGFNRYALVLGLLTAGAISSIGCSKSGGGGGFFAASAAMTTSSSTATSTSATAAVGSSTTLQTASFEDVTKSGLASKGNRIHLVFDSELFFKTQQVDASKEFTLSVQGDSFGTGALAIADPQNTRGVIIVLGDNPRLKISGTFDPTIIAAGSASGIDVSAAPSGQIVKATEQTPIKASFAKDIDGNLPAGFKSAGALVASRGAAEAATLNDGRVLVVGGLLNPTSYATDAELYDPLTNQFVQVKDLSGPTNGRMMNGSNVVRRIQHQVTKLQDGTVLITGGYGVKRKGFFGLGKDKTETLDAAHLFDPATNTFKTLPTMEHDRHSHSATLLSDGRVLLAGGYSDSWWSKNSTEAPFEAYNPKTGKFEDYHHWLIITNKMADPREEHAAVGLDGGARVLLAGGEHWHGGWLHWFGKSTLDMNGSSEVFVTSKNTSTKVGNLAHARRHISAALLASTEVLVAGGDDLKGIVPTFETWNPGTNNWTDRGALHTPRTNAKIATNGVETMIIGGFTVSGQMKGEVAEVEVFDVTKGALSTSYQLAQARNGCAVATLLDGRIMVIGGFVGTQKNVLGVDGQAIGTCEIFSRP